MKLRLTRLILTASMAACASVPALADLFPHLTHQIVPAQSPGSVDLYADGSYSLTGPPAADEMSSDSFVSSEGTQGTGDIVLAYGPSLEGGPGRIYFTGADISTSLDVPGGLDLQLVATPGPDGVSLAFSSVSFNLDTSGDYPRAELSSTGTPGLYTWGPIDLPLEVNRSVDWSADIDGQEWMSGTEIGGPVSTVSVAGLATDDPLEPGVSFDFQLTESEISLFESGPAPGFGDVDLDIAFGVDVVDFDVIAVPEPTELGSLAALLTVGALARRRRSRS